MLYWDIDGFCLRYKRIERGKFRFQKRRENRKKYGLKVIYDAAHNFGVKYKVKGIGSLGDVSCFSFHAIKVFNSIEGGFVCFTDNDFELDLYRLKRF